MKAILLYNNPFSSFSLAILLLIIYRSILIPKQDSSRWLMSSPIVQINMRLTAPRGGSSTWWNAILTCVSSSLDFFSNLFRRKAIQHQPVTFRTIRRSSLWNEERNQLNRYRYDFHVRSSSFRLPLTDLIIASHVGLLWYDIILLVFFTVSYLFL